MSVEDLAKQAAESVRAVMEEAQKQATEIVAAAEKEAGEIRERAEAEAREKVEGARAALEELGDRLGITGAPAPKPAAAPPPPPPAKKPDPQPQTPAPPPEPEPPIAQEPEPEPEVVEPNSSPAVAPTSAGGAKSGDAQAARLVALKLALDGVSQDDARSQLTSEYEVPDLDSLLSDVYAKAGK